MNLFTTTRTFVNRDLAALYGLPTTGLTATSWTPVTLPDSGARAGILGTSAIATQYASQKEGSPTLRGKFIREVILCQEIPPPPPNVNTMLADPPPDVTYTKRERLALHRAMAVCASCHNRMDPWASHSKTSTRWAAIAPTDQGKAIDVTGDLDGTTYQGPRELGQLLSKSNDAAKCMVTSLYRYATGHGDQESEQPLIGDLFTRFQSSGYQLRDLILDVVASDGFRYVTPPAP